jgi:small-conductance mechanosensitive channel
MSFIEMVSMIWRYLCYIFFSTLLWIVSLKVMPYPVDVLLGDKVQAAYYWTHLPWQFYAERLFLILCLSSFFVTAEKAVLHSIAKEFNQSLHRDRIKKCLYSLWVIDVLRKAGSVFNYTPISGYAGNFEKLWKPKECPYALKDLMTVFILEHFVKLGKKSGERKQTMARRIFHFLTNSERGNQLLIDDIRPFFARTEVEKVFSALDVGSAGDISEFEFVKAVDGIYQERADLIKILVTNSDVISKLDNLMLMVVGILVFFIVFPIVGFSPSEALIPLGVSLTPTIVACTLIFGESIKSIFAAIVFLFVTHPYDVGDRVYMDQGNYFVREIGLLSTTFERWDGFIVYIPNSVLATKAICNVGRTGLQSQRIEITIPAATSNIILSKLEQRILAFINNENREFAAVRTSSVEMRDLNQLVLIITLRHRFNFQEGYERLLRNNKFMKFLANTVNELGIEYYTTVRGVELIAPAENKLPV